jgi:ribosomal protein L37AE/L43A
MSTVTCIRCNRTEIPIETRGWVCARCELSWEDQELTPQAAAWSASASASNAKHFVADSV